MAWLIASGILVVVTRGQLPKSDASTLEDKDKPNSYLILLLAGVVLIVLGVGLIAVVAPPNNFDSMTYHMGRVVHWIQDRSVAHYPTNIIRQIYPGPWSSFAITNLQILSGGDRFANLIQWMSMVGSLIGVSLIAQQLGAGARGQVFAVVTCATIPMGILQGSSTQNDFVVSFWLVCLAYCVLQAIQSKFENHYWILAAGASLGLAILTKGTAYLYAFPFCLWLVFSGFRRLQFKLLKPMVGFGAIALALNISHYFRNWYVFGSFIGESGQGLEVFSLNIFLSNILRNIALHLSTPVRSINLITIGAVENLHALLGVDASDPRTTSPPGQSFDIHGLINHEDLAGNPLHLFLFVAVTIAFFLIKQPFKRRQRYFLATYWLVVVAGFLLFCALIVWSPWRSRLHLPIFVLAAPFIGSVLAEIIGRRFTNIIVAGLLCISFIWVGFNETRPLILNSQVVETQQVQNIFNQSRIDQYFAARPDLKNSYIEAARFIEAQGCSSIGLNFGGNTWEYPFWVLLNSHAKPSLQIKHVGVNNASSAQTQMPAYRNFIPCAVVAHEVEATEQEEIVAFQDTYRRQWHEGGLSIFLNQTISIQNK
ncbi:MAG: glycosyltransferase family 39 protein [Elainellaceae cyanobacterium]